MPAHLPPPPAPKRNRKPFPWALLAIIAGVAAAGVTVWGLWLTSRAGSPGIQFRGDLPVTLNRWHTHDLPAEMAGPSGPGHRAMVVCNVTLKSEARTQAVLMPSSWAVRTQKGQTQFGDATLAAAMLNTQCPQCSPAPMISAIDPGGSISGDVRFILESDDAPVQVGIIGP